MYTTRTGIPILVPSYGIKIATSEYIQVYQFAFSYCKSPRKWIRFTLSINTSVESMYWSLRTANTFGLNKSRSYELPSGLTSMLEKSLASLRDFNQDSCLNIFLGKDSGGVERRNDSTLQIKLSRPSFQAKEYLQRITSDTYLEKLSTITRKTIRPATTMHISSNPLVHRMLGCVMGNGNLVWLRQVLYR